MALRAATAVVASVLCGRRNGFSTRAPLCPDPWQDLTTRAGPVPRDLGLVLCGLGRYPVPRGHPGRLEARRVREALRHRRDRLDFLRRSSPLDRREVARGCTRRLPVRRQVPAGVTYITYNDSLTIGGHFLAFGQAEAVGYLDGGLPGEPSTGRYPLHKEPDKLLALEEGFGRVLLNLFDAFRQPGEPGARRVGKLGGGCAFGRLRLGSFGQ
jgi:hypothetical protein